MMWCSVKPVMLWWESGRLPGKKWLEQKLRQESIEGLG